VGSSRACARPSLASARARAVQSCQWQWQLGRFGEILADTVIEFLDRGDVAHVVRGKASGYGHCPPPRAAAGEHVLYKSVLRLHSTYEAMSDLLPSDACSPIEALPATPPDGGVGRALWVLRGTCNFLNKTMNAHAAGATAVIVGNAGKRKSSSTELIAISCPAGLAEHECETPIPTVMISDLDSSRLFRWYKQHEAPSVRIFAAETAPVDVCALQAQILKSALYSAFLQCMF
jgi:hypothetical protein